MTQMIMSGLTAEVARSLVTLLQNKYPHVMKPSAKHGEVKEHLSFTSGPDWVAVTGKVPVTVIPLIKAYAEGAKAVLQS